MAHHELLFSDLPVGIRLTEAEDSYEVGVVIEGALFPFGRYTKGGFEDDLDEAREAAPAREAQAQADAQAAGQQTTQTTGTQTQPPPGTTGTAPGTATAQTTGATATTPPPHPGTEPPA